MYAYIALNSLGSSAIQSATDFYLGISYEKYIVFSIILLKKCYYNRYLLFKFLDTAMWKKKEKKIKTKRLMRGDQSNGIKRFCSELKLLYTSYCTDIQVAIFKINRFI